MSKHFKHPVINDEGLDADDLIAIERDRAADRPKGQLNGFGFCCDCGLGPFSPGEYYCPACDREDW